jgi:hypothetical protein
MALSKRRLHRRLLVFGFATVAGLGLAGALLDSNSNANRANTVSEAYDSGLNWTDPNAAALMSFDSTNAGVQSEPSVAVDSVSVASGATEPGAFVPPASVDPVGSILIFPDVLDGATAEQWRLAAAAPARDWDDSGWVSLSGLSGYSGPPSTLSSSAGGRSSGYAGAGGGSGGSFGGGGSGSSGRPNASADAGGQLDSGMANSTSGESAHASGRRADTPPPFSANASSSAPALSSALASSSAPGLSLVSGSAFGLSLPVQSAPFNSLLPSNSVGPTATAASTLEVAQVPEPSTLILLVTGLGFLARRRSRQPPA